MSLMPRNCTCNYIKDGVCPVHGGGFSGNMCRHGFYRHNCLECRDVSHIRLGPQQLTQEEAEANMQKIVDRLKEIDMNAILRLKLLVGSVKKSVDQDGNPYQEEVVLSAVYGKEGTANNQWSKWTPSGTFNFTISNPSAFDKVLPGQYYFVDLTPTDKDAI